MSDESNRFGKYELIKPLARGGMAEIFLAEEKGIEGVERQVVVKRVLPHMAEAEDFVTMFMDEARLVARLTHPNIAHIYNFGEVDGTYFLAMEYVEGMTISALMRMTRPTPLPVEMSLRIVADMCAGLHYAHEARDKQGQPMGVVHRDVSPQNVMISRNGVAKLIDFGVARATTQAHATKAGQLKGKLGYISPEQFRSQPVDRRADVFGAGAVLYEMVTAKRAFVRENEAATVNCILNEDVPQIPTDGGVPAMVDAIVRKATAKEPVDRYESALEMQGDIEGLMARRGYSVTPFLLGQFVVEKLEQRKARKSKAAKQKAAAGWPGEADSSGPGGITPPSGPTPSATPFSVPAPPSIVPAGTKPGVGPADSPHLGVDVEFDEDAETVVSEPGVGSWSAQPGAEVAPSYGSQPSVTSQPSMAPPSMTTPGPASDLTFVRMQRRRRLTALAAVVAAVVFAAVVVAVVLSSRDDGEGPDRTVGTGGTDGTGPVLLTDGAAGPGTLEAGAGLLLLEAGPTDGSASEAGAAEVGPGLTKPPPTPPPAKVRPPPRPPRPPRPPPDPRPPIKRERAFGTLFLHTSPWSKVRVGGRNLGTTPVVGAKLPAGSHTVVMVDEKGQRHTRRVRIQADQPTKVFVKLRGN